MNATLMNTPILTARHLNKVVPSAEGELSLLDDLSASERPPAGSIRENELELIRQSLDNHQGNVSAAAEALGISRATLYRKLKQLRV